MNNRVKKLGIIVIVFAVISLAVGAVFIQQGFAKEAFLTEATKQEQITMAGVDGIIDNAAKAQLAGDTVREHRHSIAPTYGDLLQGGRFDPTNSTQLTYGMAMSLETYLYLAVASYGVFTVVKVTGLFMIVMGLALGATGYGLVSTTKA